MRTWWVVALIAGCSYKPTAATAPGDGDPDSDNGDLCLGISGFRICQPPPTDPFSTGDSNNGLNTGTDPRCTPVTLADHPELCVVVATDITIGAGTLFATGARPLVLFASGEIHVIGGVDVGSHQMGQAEGAGHDNDSCLQSSVPTSSGGSGGGGAGGSFVTKGGDGGNGFNGPALKATAPEAIGTPGYLRGGCRGSAGAAGSQAGGTGNFGGGAVMLLSATSITIDGLVNASGAGGNAGPTGRGGGGGGGSGGMIVLSAPTLAVPGRLIANGGGGASGASGGDPGGVGGDANLTTPAMPAIGGVPGGGPGGHGGIGSANTTNGGPGNTSMDGGGGGGGGLGVIRVLSGQTLGGMVSPMPSS